jgi:predicted dehydrogenase
MERLKVGIVGLGSWGLSHLEAYRDLPFVEVVAVSDIRPERRQLAQERYGIPHAFEDAESMMKMPDIGLVSVVTFEQQHLEPVLLALSAGKNVLVEKPVATRLEETRAMQEAARKYGKFVVPGHLLRFEPKYAEIRRMIAEGELGPVASIYMKRSRESSLFRTYRRTHTVHELMIHDLDQAIWYAGSRVKRVYATGRFPKNTESPDVLWAQLTFENGIIAVLHANWMTPDEAGIAINDCTEVIGEKGIAHFDTHAAGVQLWGTGGRRTSDLSVHHNLGNRVIGALKEELSYVSLCALTGTTPDVLSFDDAVHGLEVAEAIVISAKEGRVVDL